MSDLTPFSFVATTSQDDAPDSGPLPIDSNVNYADKDEVVEWFRANVFPLLPYVRQQRQRLEEEWREIRRMRLLQHDNNQSYIGRSKAYVPTYARAHKTLVSMLARGLFPSDEYLEVTAEDGTEGGKPVRDYLWYEFEKGAHLRQQMKPFLRQHVDFGMSVAKVWYNKPLADMKTRARKVTDLAGLSSLVAAPVKDSCIEGLRFSTRNLFSFYVWPTTVDSLAEATCVFEDISVSHAYIAEMVRLGRWLLGDEALNAPIIPEKAMNEQQQLTDQTNTPTGGNSVPGQPGGDLANGRTLTEVWLKMPLPRSAYIEGEIPGTPVIVKATVSGANIHEVRRHPFWHQQIPYLVSRSEPEAGSWYGKGAGFLARYLQYLVNDFANQTNDNGTYAMNPFAKVNPSTLAGPLSPLKPGGIWYTLDPKSIEFDRPPVEQINYGMQLLSMWQSALMDNVGAPPIMQGTNAGKGARTATSSQILQKNAQNPIQDMVEDIEGDVMNQLMEMTWSLGSQYRKREVMAKIAGQDIKVSPEQLIGDFQFRWLASSQAANQQQRSQQVMALIQMAPLLMQVLQPQGKTFNVEPLLKRLYTDGFGFRGFDQIVTAMPMQPGMLGMPPGMAPPGAPPGAPPEANGSTNPFSDEQALGEGGGEDFGEVRDGADETAAAMGSGGF